VTKGGVPGRAGPDAEPVDGEHLSRIGLGGQRRVVETGSRGGDEQRVPAGTAERA
jgi:hypothetical protein